MDKIEQFIYRFSRHKKFFVRFLWFFFATIAEIIAVCLGIAALAILFYWFGKLNSGVIALIILLAIVIVIAASNAKNNKGF